MYVCMRVKQSANERAESRGLKGVVTKRHEAQRKARHEAGQERQPYADADQEHCLAAFGLQLIQAVHGCPALCPNFLNSQYVADSCGHAHARLGVSHMWRQAWHLFMADVPQQP